ncbi:MAG TPA: hypothetical protein VGD60_03145 [Candidatus Acidoferrales bacterium]
MLRKLAFTCTLLTLALGFAAGVRAQSTTEVKEKPPMYTYASVWNIPRAQWGEMEKTDAADNETMGKALASGTIVGYGHDTALVHRADGPTHDQFWSAMSMAGLMNVLEQFYKNGSASNPVLSSATKHYDEILVSRYYNWTPGTCKGCYTHGGFYKLKADAPNDALETLSKNIFVPLFEKLLADGAIKEYEIDTQAIHTESPDTFSIFYITPNAEGLDKVNEAIRVATKANPLMGASIGPMLDSSAHRDELTRTDATYK